MLKKILQANVFLTLAIFLALTIRVVLIFIRKYPSGDEIWAYYLIQSGFREIWLESLSVWHAPFYFLFFHFLSLILGNLSIISLRFVSLVFGVLSNFGIWYLGSLAFGKKVGLVAFFISLFSSAFIWPAIYARYYSLLILLATLAIIVFIKFLKRGDFKNLLLLALLAVVGIYTHYYFGLLYISFSLFLVLVKKYRRLFKKWLFSMFVISLFLLPALFYFFSLPKIELGDNYSSDILKIPALLPTNLTSFEVLLYLFYNANFYLSRFFIFGFSIVSMGLIIRFLRSSEKDFKNLFLLLVIVPPFIATLFAYVVKPLLALSSLQIFLPALIVVLAYGIIIDCQKSKIMTYLFIGANFISLILFFKSSLTFKVVQEDFKTLISEYKVGDVVIHSHIYSFIIGKYYLGENVNFGIASAFNATPQTEEALGYKIISPAAVMGFGGRIWFIDPPYDFRPEIQETRIIFSNNYVSSKAEISSIRKQHFQENQFDVYLYERRRI